MDLHFNFNDLPRELITVILLQQLEHPHICPILRSLDLTVLGSIHVL